MSASQLDTAGLTREQFGSYSTLMSTAKIRKNFEITKKKRKKFGNASPVMWGVMRSGTSMQIQLNWSANSVNLVSKFSEFGGPFSIFCFVVDIVLSYK